MRLLIYLGSFVLTTSIGVLAIAGVDGRNNSGRSPAKENKRVESRSESFFDNAGSSPQRTAASQQKTKNC